MPGIAPVGDDVSGHLGGVARNGTYGAWHERDMTERYGTFHVIAIGMPVWGCQLEDSIA